MESSSDFPTEKYIPDNKNQKDLEKDQHELLSHFEHVETQLTVLKDSKNKDSHRAEIKKLMNILIEIEKLWKKSRQMSFQLKNNPYEDIGIVQYRMLLFLEKRKAYRTKLENIISQNKNTEKDDKNQNVELSQQKKFNTKENKQLQITEYLKSDLNGKNDKEIVPP